MTKHFERDVEQLTHLLETQLNRVRHNARIVLLSTGEEDGAFIPDKELDQFEVILEEECLKISALHQPVAHDLRFLTVVIKANRDLERIGDLLENILEFNLSQTDIQVDLGETDAYLPPLFAEVEKSIRDASTCLSRRDEELAKVVWAHNKEIDRLCDQMTEKMRTVLLARNSTAHLLDALLSVRYAKRAADHAANIAKDVIYLSTGEIVRHRRKEILGNG